MASMISNTGLGQLRERVQTEGRKLAGRVRDDVTAFVNRNPRVVLDDVRKRAAAATKELEAQRERLNTLLAPLGRVASQLMGRSGIASAQEVADLKRRVEELERRTSRSKAA
jgi:polyhydroxyalkanoate synthesis regulator phasin